MFTPKSLLRHRLVRLGGRGLHQRHVRSRCSATRVDGPLDPAAVRRVLLCSGKVFYDLLQARTERGITDTAIIRLEQLYPLPVDEVKAALARYPNAEDFVWVQEEPANQGAWSFIALNLLEHLDGVPLRRISRPAAAAPAVGSTKMHDAEQAATHRGGPPPRVLASSRIACLIPITRHS